MEIPTTKKCLNCDEPARDNSNWCSQVCFELWYSLQQAKVLNEFFNKILDEHFGVNDVNTRRR